MSDERIDQLEEKLKSQQHVITTLILSLYRELGQKKVETMLKTLESEENKTTIKQEGE